MILVKIAVAPHAGAWIEIYNDCDKIYIGTVAPHAGARVESVNQTICQWVTQFYDNKKHHVVIGLRINYLVLKHYCYN